MKTRVPGRWSRRLLLTTVVLVGACANSEAPSEQPEELASIPWAERTAEQRGQFMEQVILPEMEPILLEFDPDHGEVNCKSCHGEDPKAAHFEMPSPDLPELDPADSFAAHEDDEVQFMMDKVSPKMAELLGVEPWSPENQGGFGCFSCHPSAE